jgi:eukaryotic-like serine/threonine-protein kinase
MPLGPGARLDAYELLEPLGAGGMGEVWLARETRLGRKVALKLLPAEVTRDSARVSRFEQEARAASALNHPNVCTIHALGETADGQRYIALEYVEGETLRRRIAAARLTVRASMDVAVQVAAALAAAHASGIVHRDVKPENVMLRRDGFVKVLDFGIAKLTIPADAAGADATQTAFRTSAGTVVGTVAYMSPEQARGEPVDQRTDVWSLGVVLYEMLAGRAPFGGASSSDTLAAILDREPPPIARFEPEVPAELERILAKALRKDCAQRYQTMQDLLLDLEALREDLLLRSRSGIRSAERRSDARAEGRTLAAWPWSRGTGVAGLGAVILVLVLAGWWYARTPPPAPSTPAAAAGQRTLARLTFDPGLQTDPAFSPDGRFVAFASNRNGDFDIYVQQLTGGDAVQVTRSAAHDTQPRWSPDGSTIAFRSERDGGGIYVVPALGGAERKIADGGAYPSWSPDGSEVRFLAQTFLIDVAIMRAVPAGGGPVRDVFPEFTAAGSWQWVAPRSDGRISFLGTRGGGTLGFFTVSESGVTASDLSAVSESLATMFDFAVFGRRRFEWNPAGTALLFEMRSAEGVRNLWRVAVDPVTLAWTRLERLTTGPGSDVAATFSPDGRRVVFSVQQASEQLWEYTLTDTGLQDGRALTESGASALAADVSADGDVVLFQLAQPGGSLRFWMIRGGHAPVEIAGPDGLYAKLSRDARHLAYLKRRTGPAGQPGTELALAVRSLDGTDRQLSPWGGFRTPSDWSLDGRFILTGGAEVRSWPVDSDPSSDRSRLVFAMPERSNIWQGRYSPDGRWLTFVNVPGSNAPAREQSRASRHQAIVGVTTSGGPPERPWVPVAADGEWVDKPRWSADGRRLYFIASEGGFLDVWYVAFDTERGVPTGDPVRVTKFDSPSFKVSTAVQITDWSIGGRKAFLTMTATSGSLWMLDYVDR